MGGKVLVSTEEHVQRVIAARLQADIMKVPLVIVARTDAEAATLMDSNIDPRDHPFIKGATVPNVETLRDATAKGTSADWAQRAKSMTFVDLVASKLSGDTLAKWHAEVYNKPSLDEMRAFAKSLGAGDLHFDWEAARTVEGFYSVKGCTKFCSQQAKEFAKDTLSVLPHLMLAYNQSPSFNWDASGLTDEQMKTYCSDLAKLGYCWQFITLAGFHSDALGISTFARRYKNEEMYAYVSMIQRKERDEGVSTLTHQKWSGSELIDAQIGTVTAGMSSTGIMSAGVTETQFVAKK